MRTRYAIGLAVLAGVGLVVVGAVAPQPVLGALGWASLAGLGASLMMRGSGLRAMAILGAGLALASGGIALWAGGVSLAALLPAVALLAASLQAWRTGAAPAGPHEPRERTRLTEWQRMDAGEDPTRDEH